MRWRALIAALPLVALAACAPSAADSLSSGAQGSETASSTDASDTATTTSAPATLGPEIPPDTAVAKPVDPALMPTVTGAFGEKPTITFPSTPAPTTLQRQILVKGTGATVTTGSWVQANYLGQVWAGKVFDNSYDKGSLLSFQIGAEQQQVVSGWEVGLTGTTVGSRVLLTFPSQDGYGAAGQEPDIPGGATLAFVVDVVNVIGPDAAGQPDATPQTPPADIATVTGALGSMPTIKIPSGLAAPTAVRTVVLGKGTGEPAVAGNVLVQYVVTSWDGTDTESSWPAAATSTAGPQELPLDASQSAFASLIGVPIGSRVYMEMPADSSSGQPALAWVFDLVMQLDKTATTTTGATASGTDTAGAATTGAAIPTTAASSGAASSGAATSGAVSSAVSSSAVAGTTAPTS